MIGAGVSGLAAAVALSREGARVTVLEGEGHSGGRARSWVDPVMGDRVDVGPHVLLQHYPSFRELLRAVGTEDRIVWQETSGLTMVYGTEIVETQIGDLPPPLHYLTALRRHPRAHPGDLIASLPAVTLALSVTPDDVRALDDVDACTLLRAIGVPERSLRAIWGFAAHSVLNVPLERCSAGALLRLAGYFLSKRAPCFGFPSIALGDLFVPGAEAKVIAAGGEVRHGARVALIAGARDHATGVRLEDGTELDADAVIAAVPPRALAAMLGRHAAHDAFSGLSAFEPVPYASVYLWLDRKLGDRPFWARPYDPDGLGTDFYDLSSHRTDVDRARSLVAVNVIASQRVSGMDDDSIVRGLVTELAETWPHVSMLSVRHAAVHRVPEAVPAAAPGVERHRIPNVTPVRGLIVAGDWTDTGLPFSMESAAESGFRAAEEAICLVRGERPRIVREVGPREGLARAVHALASFLPRRPSTMAMNAVERA